MGEDQGVREGFEESISWWRHKSFLDGFGLDLILLKILAWLRY